MGLIYFISFFTLIAAAILIWGIVQLWRMPDNQAA